MGRTDQDYSLAIVRGFTQVDGVSLGQDLPGVNDRLRKLGIHGLIPNADTTWINFIRHEPVSRLSEATPDDLWRAVAQRNTAIAAKKKSAMQAGDAPAALDVKASSELGVAEKGLEDPIQASQTFAMKGYGEAVPNAQTRKYLPEWDRLFRGLPLSAEDESKVDAILLSKNVSDVIASGSFWKDDPAFVNTLSYLKRKQEAFSPELKDTVDDLIKREAAYEAAAAAYYTTPEYKAYSTAFSTYLQSPEYASYQAARRNYTNTPEYKAYKDATAKFQATPEFMAYSDALKKWQATPEHRAYLQAINDLQSSPAFRSWQYKMMNTPGFNEPPPMPTEPAGKPTPPDGAPKAPSQPVEPPGKPVEPPRPDALKVKPDPTELSEDGQRLYLLRKLANDFQARSLPTPLKPSTMKPLTAEEQREVRIKKLSGCARRFLGL